MPPIAPTVQVPDERGSGGRSTSDGQTGTSTRSGGKPAADLRAAREAAASPVCGNMPYSPGCAKAIAYLQISATATGVALQPGCSF